MKITVPGGISNHGHITASARCPHCGKEVVLESLGQYDFGVGNEIVCGQRRCPNPECKGHMFVAFQKGKLAISYPPVRIDFNSENIPQTVLSTFEESLNCHANGCFVASAIMVRRTLEEICADRGANGNNLKARLKNLGSKIVLPQELLEAMDELRLLGNEAAHLEAKDYENISNTELTVAIEFTKEILKSLYQYSSLLSKLRALKKTPVANA